MENLAHPLKVLSRCIHYKNLTLASQNIGLSQPQLSRIINSLEKQLDVTLLNRLSKRKATWTPIAREFVTSFLESERHFLSSLERVKKKMLKKELFIATLEGLSTISIDFCHEIFKTTPISKIHLDILDLNEMEQSFFNSQKDLIFTSRAPQFEKTDFMIEVGFQHFTNKKKQGSGLILSSFEHERDFKKHKENQKNILVSNSLKVREEWFEKYGGNSHVPTQVYLEKQKNSLPVLILGQKYLNLSLWNQVIQATEEIKKQLK